MEESEVYQRKFIMVLLVPDTQDAADIEGIGSIVWNYYKINGVQSKLGCAKNVKCTFCDAVFGGCSSMLLTCQV